MTYVAPAKRGPKTNRQTIGQARPREGTSAGSSSSPGQTSGDTQCAVAGAEPSERQTTDHPTPNIGASAARPSARPRQGQNGAQAVHAEVGSIYTLIREWCDRLSTLDDHTVAERIIGSIPEKHWKKVVYPLILAEVQAMLRPPTRAAEQEALRLVRSTDTGRRAAPAGRGVVVPEADPDRAELMMFAALLNRPLRIDGRKVLWGDATLAQHKLRREMLDAHVRGTARSRDLHDLAIRVCESRGVDSLRPLFTSKKKGGAA